MAARLRRVLGDRGSLRRRVARLALVGVLLLAAQLGAQLVAGMGAQYAGAEATRFSVVRNDVARLGTAMDDQRSGLLLDRTARLSEFQLTYATGRAETDRALRQLGRDAAGTREAPLVRRAAASAGAWDAWAQGALTRSTPPDVPELVEGERLFSRFRTDYAALDGAATTDTDAAGNAAGAVGLVAFFTSIGGSLAVAAVLVALTVRMIQLGVEPVLRLSATARRVAAGEPAVIEATGSTEIRELAHALEAWQEAAAERAVVAEQAPTGIVRIDCEGRIVSVNRAFELMHRRSADELRGVPLCDLVHPDDRARSMEVMAALQTGRRSSETIEARGLRGDGSAVWCSVTIGRLLGAGGEPAGSVAVVEDISARKLQSERASRIQRELWPQEAPRLEGYEVAGGCLPALEVAGDLYDWAVTPDGQLELTLADVMGKGIGAALVTSMLRTALRSAPTELGPAAKLALAARWMTLGRDEDATFVTVFHARLDPDTGLLRYVDAGHGYCHVLRANGAFTRLPAHSLPLGVAPDTRFQEGTVHLEPGDTLVAYSDGLLEQPVRPAADRPLEDDVREAADAADVVRRLLARMPARLADDVTALALRRVAADRARAVA